MRYEGRWVDGHKEWPTKNKGLTLIEVLVLVAIIAILVVLLLPVLHRARQAAKEAAEKDKNGAVLVMPVQAEKSPVFQSGQEIVTVGNNDLARRIPSQEQEAGRFDNAVVQGLRLRTITLPDRHGDGREVIMKNGFTLIELLVTGAIIFTLVAAILLGVSKIARQHRADKSMNLRGSCPTCGQTVPPEKAN